jgi:hypothetical protein
MKTFLFKFMGIETTFQSDLKSPPKKFRPFVRWWWPGLDVEKKELLKELQELDEQGFGGAEIQAFLFGIPGNIRSEHASKIHRFAPNPFYYEMLEIVCQEAKNRGFTIDLTIGSAWPPGGTMIKDEDSLQTLLIGTSIVDGSKSISVPIPPIQINSYYKYRNLMKGLMGPILEKFDLTAFHPIATVAVRPIKKSRKIHFIRPKATPLDIHSVQNLSSKVNTEGILNWEVPPGSWQIFTFYTGPCGMCPMLDARSSPNQQSLVVDLFNKAKIQHFLTDHLLGDATQKLKPYLGNTIRSVFTDSQEIASEWFWTYDFFEEFENRRGYDIIPYLPVCFVPNRDNQFLEVFFQGHVPCFDFPNTLGERIRRDWLETLSELWAERYCQGVSQWGQSYGLLHRI